MPPSPRRRRSPVIEILRAIGFIAFTGGVFYLIVWGVLP